MLKQYHLTDNGAKKCGARPGNCPLKTAHFSDKEQADLAYEMREDKKSSPLRALVKRDKTPYYEKHIAAADKIISGLEKDFAARTLRQNGGLISDAIAAEGFSNELIEERLKESLDLRSAGLGYVKTGEGENKALGITYTGDHKAEEEYGISAIAKSLREGNHDQNDVLLHEEEGITYFIVKGEDRNGHFGVVFGPIAASKKDAKERLLEKRTWGKSYFRLALERKSYADLKTEYAGIIEHMPLSKEALVEEIEKAHNEKRGLQARGGFQNGTALVIATKDPLEIATLKKLKVAHESGSLRLGNSVNEGAVFYDDRDISATKKEEQIRTTEATKYAKTYVEETKQKLSNYGTVFAVSPKVDHTLKDIREAKYHLNFSPKNGPQMWSRSTKAELEELVKKYETV